MQNIRYIGTKPREDAYFDRTGIIWTTGMTATVLDEDVANEMLKHTDVFQDAGDASIAAISEAVMPTPAKFGAVGDGVSDDTQAIQDFVDFITSNHCAGYAPNAYLISGKIDVEGTYGWSILGAGRNKSKFIQAADNTPIFDLGAVAGPGLHSYKICDIGFDYVN